MPLLHYDEAFSELRSGVGDEQVASWALLLCNLSKDLHMCEESLFILMPAGFQIVENNRVHLIHLQCNHCHPGRLSLSFCFFLLFDDYSVLCAFVFLQKTGSDGSDKMGNLGELQEQLKHCRKELQQTHDE